MGEFVKRVVRLAPDKNASVMDVDEKILSCGCKIIRACATERNRTKTQLGWRGEMSDLNNEISSSCLPLRFSASCFVSTEASSSTCRPSRTAWSMEGPAESRR